MEFGDAFDVLSDTSTYTEMVGAAGAGFMASSITANLAERFAPGDLPDEANGLAVIALAEVGDVPYARPMQFGAGVYTADALARRAGVKETITSIGN